MQHLRDHCSEKQSKVSFSCEKLWKKHTPIRTKRKTGKSGKKEREGKGYKGFHSKGKDANLCGCSADWNDASNELHLSIVLLFFVNKQSCSQRIATASLIRLKRSEKSNFDWVKEGESTSIIIILPAININSIYLVKKLSFMVTYYWHCHSLLNVFFNDIENIHYWFICNASRRWAQENQSYSKQPSVLWSITSALKKDMFNLSNSGKTWVFGNSFYFLGWISAMGMY